MAIDNCTQCEHHLILPDPDPNDWFNDDDIAVKCTKASTPSKDRYVTRSCRPYNLIKECVTPTWCPLNS